jgi:hypothetical protein
VARPGSPIRPPSIADLTRSTAGTQRRWLMTERRTRFSFAAAIIASQSLVVIAIGFSTTT